MACPKNEVASPDHSVYPKSMDSEHTGPGRPRELNEAVKVLITFEQELLDDIDAEAEKKKSTGRSALVRDVMRANIPRRRKRKK